MATQSTIEAAHLILPHLVLFVQKGQILTYKELGEKVGRHPRTFSHPLGYIRDEICEVRNLPKINVIVVNSDTLLPGESFLPEGTAGLTQKEIKDKYRDLRDEVFSYRGWNDLLQELGLEPVEE